MRLVGCLELVESAVETGLGGSKMLASQERRCRLWIVLVAWRMGMAGTLHELDGVVS